jgi:hypothetical protein
VRGTRPGGRDGGRGWNRVRSLGLVGLGSSSASGGERSDDVAYALAAGRDGKLVVAGVSGSSTTGSEYDWALARYTARRVAARWLLRYLEEHPAATIEEAGVVAACLRALGSPGHDEAKRTLRAMTDRPS